MVEARVPAPGETRKGGELRLVTRGDLDGLTCALLISDCEDVEWVRLVHPQQIANREITITHRDILANLPYHSDCGKWFDNVRSSSAALPPEEDLGGAYRKAPSAARVVYDYYRPQRAELERYTGLVDDVDRLDSGTLTREDVIHPSGYILLGFTLDPRSGLGAYEDYFHLLLGALKQQKLEHVLALPEVVERVARMKEQDSGFRAVTLEHTREHGDVLLTDFRPVYPIPSGNRFLVYTLFPEASVSVRVHWGPDRQEVIVAVAHSVLNRTCRTDIGELMSRFGGGGHAGAGSCVFKPGEADARIAEVIVALRADTA